MNEEVATISFPPGCLAYQADTTLIRPIRIKESFANQLRGHFIWSKSRETIAFNALSVVRLQLPGGCRVQWLDSNRNQQLGVIERREGDGDGLWSYCVRDEMGSHSVAEHHLAPLNPPATDPLLLLRNLRWSSAGMFARRAHFEGMRLRWTAQTHGMPGLLGARVRPLPHQLAAVRRVMSEGSPRMLLADEVGLGKTIEAGLVLQALLHRDPSLRILVIAPGAMGRQWLAELYLRFGAQVFTLLDQGMLRGFGRTQTEAYFERCLLSSRVVASASLLTQHPEWFDPLLDSPWDAVVVDEVHRYQRGSALYPLLLKLSQRARIFLALSATPSRNDLSGLQDLLRLVNPAPDAVPIELQMAERRDIWFAIHNTRQLLRPVEDEEISIAELSEALESLWAFLSGSDSRIVQYVADVRTTQSREPAIRLLSYVQERYRIDHRLVRSRRQWVEKNGEPMARRSVTCLLATSHQGACGYLPDPAELEIARKFADFSECTEKPEAAMLRAVLDRLCLLAPSCAVETLSARQEATKELPDAKLAQAAFRRLFDEPEPALEKRYLDDVIRYTPKQKGEKEWLQELLNWAVFWKQENPVPARFLAVSRWISEFWQQNPKASILIFVQDPRIVKELCYHLGDKFGRDQVGQFHAERSQLELEEVARAFQRGALTVLVSDELGGEGRNFQHAEAVIHIDLPWSPSRVEQRIGRLDRIGRPTERDVLSVVCCGPSELEYAVFNMLYKTFGVFERTIGPIEFRVTTLRDDLSQAVARGAAALESMQPAILEAISAAKEEDDELLDAALQLSQHELEEGKELAEAMKHLPWQDWQQAASGWARELGITCEPQVNGTLRVQVKPEQMHVDVAGVNPLLQTGIYGTFSKKQALADESIHLFGPGHPFLETLELLVDRTWLGRACVWRRDLGSANGRLYVLFHLIHEPDMAVLANKKGRAMVELAVLRYYAPGSKFVALALPNRQYPDCEIVGQDVLRRMREKGSSIGPLTVIQWATLGQPDFIYRLMFKIEEAQAQAIEWLRQQRKETNAGIIQRFTEGTQLTVEALKRRIEEKDRADAAGEELTTWLAAPETMNKEKIIVNGIQLILTPVRQVSITT